MLPDDRVRCAAFDWLTAQVAQHGDVLPRTVLAQGFQLEGHRVPLLGPQGIFKPKVIPEIPLSITTAPAGPYADSIADHGLLQYCYRGTDPMHHENVGLREAMKRRVPLIYFHGVMKGRYVAAWPVYIVGDDPAGLRFTVAVDDRAAVTVGPAAQVADDAGAEARRAYVTATVQVRLHQARFRERVIVAYRSQCALCRLKHHELLDAAHIIPDTDPRGEPVVSNGMALCKLHHAAYDRMFIGVRPDYRIIVRQDVLEESDGPMLKHGLQGMHGQKIIVPRKVEDRPAPDCLEMRWEQFRNAG